MMKTIDIKENERLDLQDRLDFRKTQIERNRLGQFATPPALAVDVLKYAFQNMGSGKKHLRFLDPAIGTGAFYSAFAKIFGLRSSHTAIGYEIDPHYGQPSRNLWRNFPLDYRIADFTRAAPNSDEKKVDLVICNPPYVRHQHLSGESKKFLHDQVLKSQHVKLSGLAGLYCYFLCLSRNWMKPDALAGWLIPSEFMDVNYGTAVKSFLTKNVTLLHIHRFRPDDVQFGDALVSSAIVWFLNRPSSPDHRVRFTFGGSMHEPEIDRDHPLGELAHVSKWTSLPRKTVRKKRLARVRLRDLFTIKRGIATGANDFFILTPDESRELEIPRRFLTPILPSPRYLQTDSIESDSKGYPVLDRYGLLFSSEEPEEVIQEKFPQVWNYLQSGVKQNVHLGYICRHRTPWYNQEYRKAAPFLCTYMGRTKDVDRRVFRFILNKSKAIAANVLLMLYPNEMLESHLKRDSHLYEAVWMALNAIPPETLVGEGRVYGGGLHKLEPKELLNAPADSIAEVVGYVPQKTGFQKTFF